MTDRPIQQSTAPLPRATLRLIPYSRPHPRDLPQADAHLNSCLDLGVSYIQANATRFPGDQPMAPWESADLFMEAGQAVSKAYALSRTAWTPR